MWVLCPQILFWVSVSRLRSQNLLTLAFSEIGRILEVLRLTVQIHTPKLKSEGIAQTFHYIASAKTPQMPMFELVFFFINNIFVIFEPIMQF